MKRKIYEKLLEWKQKSAGKTALLIDGARRVGESWIVEEFGRNEYASCLIIDFAHIPTKVKRIFNEYVNDLDGNLWGQTPRKLAGTHPAKPL